MTTLFHGWTESPEVIRERWERMRIPESDCTCTPRDEIACPACIEQAERRYKEIPYTEQEAQNEGRTSNI